MSTTQRGGLHPNLHPLSDKDRVPAADLSEQPLVTDAEAEPTLPVEPKTPAPQRELRIYGHSSILYWWPVWAVGYLMAFLTYSHGKPVPNEGVEQAQSWFHPSNNLGVVFLLVLFTVILITNFSVRGLASGMVIMGGLLLTVVLAYVGWWDEVFSWFGNLKIHLSLGAYFWFSTLMLLTWAVTVFGIDRLSYWEVTPGQLTHITLYGAGSQSYNTQGMGLEKHRDDLFRHWLLGLGSGDLEILTSGATRERIDVFNIVFIGSKVEIMQRLIAEVPDESHST
ncbi:MAG TPA: hypothetical protein VMM56_03720 [Planctomycetaceae bacterium]|nr:hypothetical protein [Planctomycetaceae bacterium]